MTRAWMQRFNDAPDDQKEAIAVKQAPPDEEKPLTSLWAVIRFIHEHGKDWWVIAKLMRWMPYWLYKKIV